MTPVTSARLGAGTLRIVDDYAAQVLRCPPDVAHAGGVHLLAVPERGLPAWHGYVMPVLGLSFASGAVVACRPDLLEQLKATLGSDVRLSSLDAAALRRLHRAVRQLLPNAFTLGGDFRVLDASTFAPSAQEDRAEFIADEDASALHLRTRFDGAIFGVRGPHGRLVSYAALKRKSEAVWEIAVATEADYRGRGYARDVVSAASRHTLDAGRIAIYIHDRDNSTSAFVARALGYQMYSEIVLGEY
ncbi:MAG: GNAT family N-acetyltransferase [Chloroflexi bacterium]|nr:GNAT family N-acetyltransferase [Chloroflexota bacterium]